jgi:hypothetical protein
MSYIDAFLAVIRHFSSQIIIAARKQQFQEDNNMISQIARMEEVMQSYVANNHFMGSILVAESDKILLDKGYSYANRVY